MRYLALLLCLIWPLTLAAQEAEQPEASDEDKGMLTNFLEDALSGDGRTVEVIGLKGAISSNATVEEIRMSDADGAWLTMRGMTLNWNRLAVLRGNININELSASEIILTRAPAPNPSAPPTAEATPFSLPELPVSINIQSLKADRITLGESFLGEELNLSLTARLILEGGNGEALLSAARLDGPAARFALDGAYSNETRNLRVDLQVHEDAGGLLVTKAKIPGEPPMALTVLGDGSLDDFIADILLTSDGEQRLAGSVELATEPGATPESAATQVVRADLGGNMAPLFAPDYKGFLGENIGFSTLLRRFGDGRITLQQLLLSSRSLNLNGEMAIDANGLPDSFDLDIQLRDETGKPVLLPLKGPKNYVQGAELAAQFDHAAGDRWTLSGTVDDLKTDTLTLARVALFGEGTLQETPIPRVEAQLQMGMRGLALSDPDLATVVGSNGGFQGDVVWEKDAGLTLSNYSLRTNSLGSNGTVHVSGSGQDLTIDTDATLKVDNISLFSAFAKRDLSGALSAQLKGAILPVSQGFDLALSATGQDLAISDQRADALLAGTSTVALSAKRDENGITLREANVKTPQLSATGGGTLASQNSDLTFEAALNEVALVLKGVNGPATAKGRAVQTGADWAFDLAATAPAQTTATIRATLPQSGNGAADIDLEVGQVQVFVPELPGKARIQASAEQAPNGWQVDFKGTGPFDTKGAGKGLIDPSGSSNDFSVSGTVPLAAANAVLQPNSIQGIANYDLRLKGALGPEAVTGSLTLGGARFVIPDLRVAFEDIRGTVGLNGRAADLNITTQFSGGGQIGVAGSVALAPPFTANLPVTLTDILIQQGQLLKTELDGTITLSGPLTGGGNISGNILLGKTDIHVTPAGLSGAGPIPEIRHLNEPAKVRLTRDRAGLIAKKKSGSSAPPFGLDVNIQTTERIAVRGLGLNADFHGGMKIGGTTNDIRPNGEIDLIRGRLSFLAKNFELDEGRISMLGDLVPTMRVVAISEQPDATVYVILDGRLDDPKIVLESDPELPEDEVLSQLLFGRDLSSISALQAAQLAAALAQLSGGGPQGPRLGENSGLDDLGLTFDESGTPGLRAGKYINENVYTEVGVDSKGQSSISLNLDVNDNLTVKGKVGSDDDTGIGIFFQRDY
ncbi:translocation/assembly module TamB domain-containing protein [Shimia sagamensis]|uniref:Autotransporter secretion inner membrane protein TamB n=1 Tax=Shimia sagamensis TaxID=1566352 RepID=A0ABY1NG12_9RHOB|nr:translocation/assembly module TamB domain-containing protein [Shimia sagamensis]SMP08113.1 autotransporter secretion inner membrane protein TamB [Shimia sagamensis]